MIPEQMSREELIEYIKTSEDIKKLMAFLKKAKEKYQIIDILKDKYNINLLCLILKCSRSGYYSWINLGRPDYKAYDESIASTIYELYSKDNRQRIKSLRMNIKTIHGIQ